MGCPGPPNTPSLPCPCMVPMCLSLRLVLGTDSRRAKPVLAADLLCSQACSAPCQERNWESQVNSSLPAFSIRISSCTGSYLLKKGPLFLDRLALQAFQTPRPPSWWLLAAVKSSISKTVLKNSCGSFLQKQFSFSLGLFS